MTRILAIALKDIKLLIRDRAGLFWVLGMPVLMALFFGSIFGSEGPTAKMGLTVVDEDQSAQSKAFVASLKESPSLKLDEKPLAEAKELVRKGDRVAYLRIPKGFGEAPMFGPGDQAALGLGQDPRRKAETGFLQGIITESWFKQMQKTFQDPAAMKRQTATLRASLQNAPNMDPEQKKAIEGLLGNMENPSLFSSAGGAAMQGPKFRVSAVSREGSTPATAFEVTFPQGILWGLIGVANAFAIGMVKERTMGTLQRLRISPLRRPELLAGKGLACFLTTMAVVTILLVFGVVLGVRTFSNPVALVMSIVASGVCFAGIMMLMSVLGKTEASVGGAGWAMMLVFSMIGGGMIPLIAMPSWMIQISNFSPVKWSIYSMEGAIWRGLTIPEMLIPCGILVGIGAFGFALGSMLQARQQN